jgi:tetratricopeptide (TPR) repeat protein
MFKEAQGLDDEAINIYRQVMEANSEEYGTYRRLAAFLRDSDLKDEAIETINSLLKVNMADTQAWFELSELFTSQMNYTKAAYCFEEILVMKPSNYLYNLKYAELLYSMGGGDNLLLARKYFSKAITLNNNADEPSIMGSNKSTRSIFGLIETCRRLESLSKKYQDEVNEELIQMCKEKLDKLYATSKFDISQMS